MPTRRVSRSKVVARAIGRFTKSEDPCCPISLLLLANRICRGRAGEESQDYGYTFTNQRRRSNSSTQALGDFKTKFETVDQDPVFENQLHGPTDEDIEDGSALEKEESTDSSTIGGSVEEEEGTKRI